MRPVVLFGLFLVLATPIVLNIPHSFPSIPSSMIEQPTASNKYVTDFKLPNTTSFKLEPVIVYPTSTVTWVLAQSYSSTPYSQILAFHPTASPYFTVNVSLSKAFVSGSLTVSPLTGKVWYAIGRNLAYYDPKNGQNGTIASFPSSVAYLTTDSQGRVWATLPGANRVGSYDPATMSNTTTTYPVPTLTSGLQGITASAPDGSIWFVEGSAIKLARLDPKTNTTQEYSAPVDVASPTQIAVDSSGVVWYSDHASSDFGSYNPATGEWRKFPVGYCLGDCAIALPNAIAIDNNNNVWFSEHLRGVIGKYDSGSSRLYEYTIPVPQTGTPIFPATWWAWPGPNNLVWFADLSLREIGYVNTTIPVPITISSETSTSAFQGEGGTVPVTVNYRGQGTVNIGVSTTSIDSRPSRLTGFNDPLSAASYPLQAAARFSVGWSASLGPRYIALTAQDGQIAVSVPVKLTVLNSVTAYLTIGVGASLGVTITYLYVGARRKQNEPNESDSEPDSIVSSKSDA